MGWQHIRKQLKGARRWSAAWKRVAKKWYELALWGTARAGNASETADLYIEENKKLHALIRQIFDICENTPPGDDFRDVERLDVALTEIYQLIQEWMESE